MQFIKPNTLQDALKARSDTGYPILAGGTDMMTQWRSSVSIPAGVINIWNIDELKHIREADGKIEIGAFATHSDIIKSGLIQKYIPALVQACKSIGAVQIQNRGTIGGNVMNASPAGDTLPVLLAYDAEVELASVAGARRVPFEKFFIGYRKTAAMPNEIVTRFIINNVAAGFSPPEQAIFMKIGTRQAQAISKVCGCFRYNPPNPPLVKGGEGGFVIAFGSVAQVPIRCRKTEEFLNSNPTLPPFKKGGEGGFNESINILQKEITPIDDIRSTAKYRRHVCGVMLKRFLESILSS